jgi:UDP-N-acetylmuramoylalanine--D-glutamate ligase
MKIGVVGLGIVGKSALRFFEKTPNAVITEWDQKTSSASLEEFLQQNDQVLVSPGVDLRSYLHHKEKFICELDLFSIYFSKKTIAITGTLGKTTVTRLTSALLPYRNQAAGNIGTPMLDLVEQQDDLDWAVLEISSFQLEQSKTFAPDVAILTNVYPNHLDRHSTMKDYFEAKWNLFVHQTEKQQALFPLDLFDMKDLFAEYVKSYRGTYSFVYGSVPSEELLAPDFVQNRTIYFLDKNLFCKGVVKKGQLTETVVLHDLSSLPKKSFLLNWVYAFAALQMVNVKEFPREALEKVNLDKHRLDLFATINGVDFYNDSKATVQEATRAAVEKLAENGKPLILIVGGLGKGVDRTPLARFLAEAKGIKKIFCLGKGCPEFAEYERYASLPELLHAIMRTASDGDQVLFSPSGTSFDLFSNFMDRGDSFERAVKEYKGDI